MRPRELLQNLAFWCALPSLPWALHSQGLGLVSALVLGGLGAVALPYLIGMIWPD